MNASDSDPPETEPDPATVEERARREINREAHAAHEAALAIWGNKPTAPIYLPDILPPGILPDDEKNDG